ncbi:MAG: hypothetical protein R3Y36_07235 [Spirochaetales bacterium]
MKNIKDDRKALVPNNEESIRPIFNFSVRHAYFFILTHIKTFVPIMRYLKVVICDFFLLQFSVKWGLRKIEVVNVDHKLDCEVPFVPSLAPVYLDFVNFWIRPLSFIIQRLKNHSAEHVARFITTLTNTYIRATEFYTFKMTTTYRPTDADYKDKNFTMIRRFDPHYLCVPSLHISVVVLTFAFYKDLFEKESSFFSEEEKKAYNAELYYSAVQIAETVLYIKQHSVNCIPAALYMMNDILGDLFTPDDAEKFIDALFFDKPDISTEGKKQINEHVHFLFERFFLEKAFESSWINPMKRWLLNYKPSLKTPVFRDHLDISLS